MKMFEDRQETKAKVVRTFEWVHTQVGDYGPEHTSRIQSGSENLPNMDPSVISGRQALLTVSD